MDNDDNGTRRTGGDSAATHEPSSMATATAFDNLVTLLEAYQRLGDSDEEDGGDGDIDPAAANGDGGDGEGDGEEEDSDELSQYASFLLANGDNDGGSGQGGAELGEVHNGNDEGGGFAMGAVETHNYEDSVIIGSTDYHVDAGSSLHHGDDELPLPLPPPGSAGNAPPLEAVAMSFLQEAAVMRLRQGTTTNADGHSILVQRLGELLRAYRANDAATTGGAPMSGRQRPASAAVIAALEKCKHGGGCGEASSSSSGAAAAQCVICIEDYEVGDDISVMPCSYGHSFHQACLADWLARSRFCPLCRHKLPADDDDEDDAPDGQTP